MFTKQVLKYFHLVSINVYKTSVEIFPFSKYKCLLNHHRLVRLVGSHTHFLPQHSLENEPGHGWWLLKLRVLLEATNKQVLCLAPRSALTPSDGNLGG